MFPNNENQVYHGFLFEIGKILSSEILSKFFTENKIYTIDVKTKLKIPHSLRPIL